jgi:hypothetical protein
VQLVRRAISIVADEAEMPKVQTETISALAVKSLEVDNVWQEHYRLSGELRIPVEPVDFKASAIEVGVFIPV